MQLRRLLSMLERPIHSLTRNSPYSPAMIQKLLGASRVHYNFMKYGATTAIGKGEAVCGPHAGNEAWPRQGADLDRGHSVFQDIDAVEIRHSSNLKNR